MDDIGFQVGDITELDTTNYVDVSGMTGPNMIWDLNDLILGDADLSTQMLTVEDVDNPISFDGANIVRELDFGSSSSIFQYFAVNDNDIQFLGYFADVGITADGTYEDPQLIFNTPMTYGSVGSDNFNAIQNTPGAETTISGESSYEIVGYGTLMLNTQTYDDVLLMNYVTVDTTIINVTGMDFTTYSTDDAYLFFKAGYHMPLLTFSHIHEESVFTGITDSYSGQILLQQTTVGIDEITNLNFSVFPNPVVQDEVTIRFSEFVTSDISIQLFDPLGKQIEIQMSTLNRVNGNDIKINMPHELSTGIYNLVVSGDNILRSAKLIIE